jgi:hypothetical protein
MVPTFVDTLPMGLPASAFRGDGIKISWRRKPVAPHPVTARAARFLKTALLLSVMWTVLWGMAQMASQWVMIGLLFLAMGMKVSAGEANLLVLLLVAFHAVHGALVMASVGVIVNALGASQGWSGKLIGWFAAAGAVIGPVVFFASFW